MIMMSWYLQDSSSKLFSFKAILYQEQLTYIKPNNKVLYNTIAVEN